MLLSETLFLFLFTFSLWVFCGKRAGSWFWMILSGLAWGWLVLTKPEMVIFAPVFFGWLLWKNYSRPALAKGLAWLVLSAMVVAPWLLREREVHGHWLWISSRGGRTFFEGNYLPIDMAKVYALAQKQGLDELEMDQLFYKITIQYLKDHPRQYFKAGIARAALLWDLRTTNWLGQVLFMPVMGNGSMARKLLTFFCLFVFNCYRAVVILGSIGALLFWERFRELALIYAIPVLLIFFHFALFIGASRYLVPIIPAICIFFALLMQSLNKSFGRGPTAGMELEPTP
jgi:4-amino-4-deoxy-L-arabinose transferase-like glycosyltransferase